MLTIADYEPGELPPIEDNTDSEMIKDIIDENDLEIQEEVLEPVVEEVLVIIPEDNLVSEKEEFLKMKAMS